MQSIETFEFSGKRAISRVDFNVPLTDTFEVRDDTRIRAAIPSIKKVLAGGGSIILMSHLGRPKEGPEDKFSLKHIISCLSKHLGVPVKFAPDCIGAEALEMAKALKGGEVLLLENLRFYKEETSKDDQKREEFAKKLAALADVYINDAFGTAHREHASTATIAKFFPVNKMFGYVMENELKAIDKVMKAPERPFTAVLGGSKVSTKITIIENLMEKVDNLIIGGGMTYTFMAAMGKKIGTSLVEEDQFDTVHRILEKAKSLGKTIHLDVDVVVADKFDNEANVKNVDVDNMPDGFMGLDCGVKTSANSSKCILESKTVLWNGPVGVFEMTSFEKGTKSIAEALVKATEKGAFTLVGGGDSVAAVNKYGFASKVSYVSTGGGALLEYMEGLELPGVAAIRK